MAGKPLLSLSCRCPLTSPPDWAQCHMLGARCSAISTTFATRPRSPVAFTDFEIFKKKIIVRHWQDRPAPRPYPGGGGKRMDFGLEGAASGHDFSSGGAWPQDLWECEEAPGVQQARKRLDRPGTRAAQQRKPIVVCLRHHPSTVCSRPGQVNRCGGHALGIVSGNPPDRRVCAGQASGPAVARLKSCSAAAI